MSEELRILIESARHILMTPERLREQEIGFAYGNVHFENPRVTRELAEQALPDDYDDAELIQMMRERAARS